MLNTESVDVVVHAGHLSLDNGAQAPLSFLAGLARLLNTSVNWGIHYGFDSIEVPVNEWPVVKELLTENKMLYKVKGVNEEWTNIQSDAVRERLSLLAKAPKTH